MRKYNRFGADALARAHEKANTLWIYKLERALVSSPPAGTRASNILHVKV